eukprot:c7674_g1_i1.p2 GENE.c7674_g1_i1~~c7674_g1_i1.p2  ORF type:complete len:142 (-),score=38.10 c7674_g1_i1:114-539(-)
MKHDGAIRIGIDANSKLSDCNGGKMIAKTLNLHYDAIPEVTVTSSRSVWDTADPAITVEFSELVLGFDDKNIRVTTDTNCKFPSQRNFFGKRFTAQLMGCTKSGTVTVCIVAEGPATDTAGNKLANDSCLSVVYENTLTDS